MAGAQARAPPEDGEPVPTVVDGADADVTALSSVRSWCRAPPLDPDLADAHRYGVPVLTSYGATSSAVA
jgi:hypothetical protein